MGSQEGAAARLPLRDFRGRISAVTPEGCGLSNSKFLLPLASEAQLRGIFGWTPLLVAAGPVVGQSPELPGAARTAIAEAASRHMDDRRIPGLRRPGEAPGAGGGGEVEDLEGPEDGGDSLVATPGVAEAGCRKVLPTDD